METLNWVKFSGHDNWELRAGGVKRQGGADSERMTIQDAVEAASLLRREDFIAQAAARGAPAATHAPVVSDKPE